MQWFGMDTFQGGVRTAPINRISGGLLFATRARQACDAVISKRALLLHEGALSMRRYSELLCCNRFIHAHTCSFPPLYKCTLVIQYAEPEEVSSILVRPFEHFSSSFVHEGFILRPIHNARALQSSPLQPSENLRPLTCASRRPRSYYNASLCAVLTLRCSRWLLCIRQNLLPTTCMGQPLR
jgi:hypothetical protein